MGGLSRGQVAWAMQHDWFRHTCRCQPADNTQGFVIGAVVYDSTENELVVFTSYKALRAWAGY